MGSLSGTRLTVLGAALIALAAAAALRVAVPGALRGTGAPARAGGAPEAGPVAAPVDHLALALDAERRGDVAAALSHYRAGVARDPRCVDRRSPGFLGPAFEAKLGLWIAGMKSGRIAPGPAGREDAAFIFRRMYGGCG